MNPLTALPPACAGHVLVDLPLFMGPVVVLVGWLLLTTRRARKREQAAGEAPTQALDRRARDRVIGVQA